MSHAEIVKARGEDPDKCVVVERDWPYDCGAKDKHPDVKVYACETHACWWFDVPGEEGER